MTCCVCMYHKTTFPVVRLKKQWHSEVKCFFNCQTTLHYKYRPSYTIQQQQQTTVVMVTVIVSRFFFHLNKSPTRLQKYSLGSSNGNSGNGNGIGNNGNGVTVLRTQWFFPISKKSPTRLQKILLGNGNSGNGNGSVTNSMVYSYSKNPQRVHRSSHLVSLMVTVSRFQCFFSHLKNAQRA